MFEARSAFKPEFIESPPSQLWQLIPPNYCIDETCWLQQLLELAQPDSERLEATTRRATDLVEQVRAHEDATHVIDALLLQYSLDTREGILLMCLAESLMRIPDARTADALIRDKLSVAEWQNHLKQSESVLVNASTWGLLLTGKVVTLDKKEDGRPRNVIARLVKKMGEPVIRQAVHRAMKIMGEHFILGRSIDEALKKSQKPKGLDYRYSFDMLGEAALTAEDAKKYFDAYMNAIKAIGREKKSADNASRLTVSIKLSALHPRYEAANSQRVLNELHDTVLDLITAAREQGVGITIDAEEQERLEISLRLFEKLYRNIKCEGWGQFGLVVQAYGKRALPTLAWLASLARDRGDAIPVRLVKGAYWDSEIKLSQQQGHQNYPVYTRKEATDVAYLVCAQFMLSEQVNGLLFPQFATHNAHTVAAVLDMAGDSLFEFQRLHGMGDALYKALRSRKNHPVRIYAPVGHHKDLLPYLVRRLLENGANSSFVHRLVDAKTPVEQLVHHPATILGKRTVLANDMIPLPAHIFPDGRLNSWGVNTDSEAQWQIFSSSVEQFMNARWDKGSIVNGQQTTAGEVVDIYCPYQLSEQVGSVCFATETDIEQAIVSGCKAFTRWNQTPVEQRACCLERLADLLQDNQAELVALCHREAGKTVHDSIDEIREAVDFCRYYARQARAKFAEPMLMPGPTGESNELYLSGRGLFLCISPWNFPLAIFLGQACAALVAGNTLILKPAEQTSLIAARAVELMFESGIPRDVIHLIAGEGREIGHRLTADERIVGIAFTGSTQTARLINQTLAERKGAIIPLIAETGGQNAMIVDSTALPEQVVVDVVQSAFASAGQRCSALRVLYVQEEIADRIQELLVGAMRELVVGDPSLHETDVGPVISAVAQEGLRTHIDRMQQEARLIAEIELGADCYEGYFVAPVAFEIESISQLDKEQFGPVLHVIRYRASELDRVIEEINNTGYGLTLGIHSRNEATALYIEQNVRSGNTYINRNQIGAVVGVQPFGGQGLSGTGPKAGGPHYLYRFATERTRTINTTAVGGNATLLSLGGEH